MAVNLERQAVSEAIAAGETVVLEVLPEPYWAREHLPGARNLPIDEIDARVPQFLASVDTPVILYCANRACRNSTQAAARLEQLGYRRVFTYKDGKQDWIEAGEPVERSAAA